jgi:hypothetical protein
MSGIGNDGLTIDDRKKTAKKRQNTHKRFFPYAGEDGESTGIKEVISTILTLEGRPDICPFLFCTTKGKVTASLI